MLINISNDGYLGPTPVMRQHLANTVFRAVENDRPVLRVTNTGITAYITARGEVMDATGGFQTGDANMDGEPRAAAARLFTQRYGDLFVGAVRRHSAFCSWQLRFEESESSESIQL